MKKITTLMVMLVCCICSALAQTVASTPTAPQDIQDGYYMLLVKTTDGMTDDAGNFAYANSYDAKGSASISTGTTFDDVLDYKYVYYVTNNGGKLRIKTAFTNNWWESASGWGKNDYRPQQIAVGESATDFTYQSNGSWTYLKTKTKKFTSEKNVFVTLNDGNKIGYWDDTNPASHTAQFQFYAVDDFPEIPFTVSASTDQAQWYYLVANGATDYLLSGEKQNNYSNIPSSKGYVTSREFTGEYKTVNDIVKDLWCVTKNADGSYNVYNRNVAQSLNKYSTAQTDPFFCDALSFGAFSGITGCDILPLSNGHFALKAHDAGYDNLWVLVGGTLKKYDAANDAYSFRMEAPTFTYTMYKGGDGHTYNTFSAPFDVKLAANGTDVKMYKGVADYTAMQFNMTEITEAPAKEGVFLMGTKDESVLFEVTSGVAEITDNSLIGSTEDVTELNDKLILGISNTTKKVGFYAPADGVTTLYANHAYLEQNIATAGLSLNFGGTPTGIGQVSTSDVKNAPIYDLTGRRVNHTVKGQLYIQGGRKFIAR